MKALRVVVADDEPAARRKMLRLLEAREDVEVVSQASNGREAVEAIQTSKPDVVFLDVQMPLLNGFQALEALGRAAGPKIVFVTAFNQYAVRAFEVRAFDYLLKPFDGPRLWETLDRVRHQLTVEEVFDAARVHDALEQLQPDEDLAATNEPSEGAFIERVCIRSIGKTQFVRMRDVEWVEAFGNYVRLHATRGRYLLRETMRRMDVGLDPSAFARVHRSAIVNLSAVREMRPCPSGGDYLVLLESGTRLRLSRSYRPELDRRLGRR